MNAAHLMDAPAIAGACSEVLVMPKGVTRAMFDVCGTLFEENTTIALIRHLARRGPLFRALRILFWRSVAAIAVRCGCLRPGQHMALVVRGLRGVPSSEIRDAAVEVVARVLTPRARALELLSQAQASGLPVGYATYTINEIAVATAERFGGVVLFACTLAYGPHGRCLGRYAVSSAQDKRGSLPDSWGSDLGDTLFVTDDAAADATLLAAVGHPVLYPRAVCTSRPRTLPSIPSVYYYATRYEWLFERVMHVVKFWGTYLLVYWMGSPHPLVWGTILPAWIAWLAVYDLGCLANDRQAGLESTGTARKAALPGIAYVLRSQLLWVALMFIFVILQSPLAALWLLALLVVLGITFTLHNRLPPQWRGTTFYALYLLKGGVLVAAQAPATPPLAYLAFCALFAAAYLPAYLLKKLPARTEEEKPARQSPWVQPIVGKNVVLLLLPLLQPSLILVWLWVNSLTLLEFVWRRSRPKEPRTDG